MESYGILGQIFGPISSFLSNWHLQVVLEAKFSQEYPVNCWSFSRFHLHFLLYINDLPDNVTCNIAIYLDNTTLYSKYVQASDLMQQLELGSERESGLQGTMDWSRKWFVDFNAGKAQLILLDWSVTLVLLVWKWIGLFLR